MPRISQQQLESYLWGAATLLRGTIDAGDYKQFIFPLLFYKRLCDVFDEETQSALNESDGDVDYAAGAEHHRFQVPAQAHWREVRQAVKNVGAKLHSAMRAIETANPQKLFGIFGDAQWTNKDRLSDAMLRDLVEHFSTLELTLRNLPEDELGQGYEYLIKKFADDSGHTAAEFYTNRTVVHLMTEMLKPQPGESIYDPTCGSGGMLLSAVAHLQAQNKEWRNVRLYGQERNLITSSIARMNCFLHGIEDFRIERGDTLSEPKLVEGDRLMRFDVVLANPPYSIKQWDRESFASDPWGRNLYGTPPQGRADYAFWQHIICSLSAKNGRCAILFPHGVLFRQEEAEMRRRLIDADLIECVLGLGPNLFYNSPMEACVVVCRKAKPKASKGRILFINAVTEVGRERSQSFLTDDHIGRVISIYEQFKSEPGLAHAATLEEVRAKEGSLSISAYVATIAATQEENSHTSSDMVEALNDWLGTLVNSSRVLSRLLPETSVRQQIELRANAGWPSQPLFERHGWKTVPFGEFAQSVNERVEPRSAANEIYVGLDDLDSMDLQIRRWGRGSDVVGTKLRFQKGDVIFGRRRAYQRKLAVAEMNGICSAHALVVRARPTVVLPEFLPFLMMSDRFMNRAVDISVGSLSPTINWTTLKLEQFELPSLDQQRRIASVLWAANQANDGCRRVMQALNNWRQSFIEQVCLEPAFDRRPLGEILEAIEPGRSLLGINQTKASQEYGVLKVSAVGPRGFDPSEHKKLVDQGAFLSRFSVRAGDFLITRCNTRELVGRVCIVAESHPTLMLCDKTIRLVFSKDMADASYMHAVLGSRELRAQIEMRATGSGGAMKNISQADIRGLLVPIPSRARQAELARALEVGSAAFLSLERLLAASRRHQHSIISAVMG